jgi:hypothetical protein
MERGSQTLVKSRSTSCDHRQSPWEGEAAFFFRAGDLSRIDRSRTTDLIGITRSRATSTIKVLGIQEKIAGQVNAICVRCVSLLTLPEDSAIIPLGKLRFKKTPGKAALDRCCQCGCHLLPGHGTSSPYRQQPDLDLRHLLEQVFNLTLAKPPKIVTNVPHLIENVCYTG